MVNEKLIRHAEATLRKIVPYKYNVPADEVEDAYRAVIEAVKQGGQIVWWRNISDERPPCGAYVLMSLANGHVGIYRYICEGDHEFIVNNDFLSSTEKPVAWMPLPR